MHTDLLLILLLLLRIYDYFFRWFGGLVDRMSREGVMQVLSMIILMLERESLVTSQMVMIGGSTPVAY